MLIGQRNIHQKNLTFILEPRTSQFSKNFSDGPSRFGGVFQISFLQPMWEAISMRGNHLPLINKNYKIIEIFILDRSREYHVSPKMFKRDGTGWFGGVFQIIF